MNKTQRKILTILQENESVTPLELTLLSGYALSGIRRRLTDLRRMGYDVQMEKVEVNKYFLKNKEPVIVETCQAADKIIDWIREKNKFGKSIDLDKLSTDLDLSLDDISDGMGKIFKKYNVLQLSSKSVLVRP